MRGKNEDELSLTMQQRFNFDSNSYDEEDTKTYKVNRKIRIQAKEAELIRLMNKYKKKYQVSMVLCVMLLLLLCVFFYSAYYKKVEVVKNVTDENIVFLGDSLTDYYDLDEYFGTSYNLVNSGKGGNTTDDILSDMKERVYRYNPSKVFILIGINDMKKQKSNDYIYNNIIKIVNEIKKNRKCAEIYVESLYPINESNDERISRQSIVNRSNKKIDEINSRLKKTFNKSDVHYIDINSKLKDEENNMKIEYTKEGVHLSKEGYEKVTKLLIRYIEE